MTQGPRNLGKATTLSSDNPLKLLFDTMHLLSYPPTPLSMGELGVHLRGADHNWCSHSCVRTHKERHTWHPLPVSPSARSGDFWSLCQARVRVDRTNAVPAPLQNQQAQHPFRKLQMDDSLELTSTDPNHALRLHASSIPSCAPIRPLASWL